MKVASPKLALVGILFMLLLIFSLCVRTPVIKASSPSSGTLSLTSAPVTWTGFAGPATSPDDEPTCVDGTNCDVFPLTLAPGDYTGKRARITLSWTMSVNDYDAFVHAQTLSGPIV